MSDQPLVVDYPALKRKGVPFTNQHLLRLEKEGRFPRRVAFGSRRVGWIYREIEAWLEERASHREEDALVRSRAARTGAATRLGKGSTVETAGSSVADAQ